MTETLKTLPSRLNLTHSSITKVGTLNIPIIQELILSNNLLTEVNDLTVSTAINYIDLSYNLISDWSTSETFANNLHTVEANTGYTINTIGNTSNSYGTNFYNILTNKGWTIMVDGIDKI